MLKPRTLFAIGSLLHCVSCARAKPPSNNPPRVETPIAYVLSSGVGAVYLRVVNDGRSDVLQSVDTPGAADAQLHEVIMRGDSSTMRPAPEGFAISAHSTLLLQHGGKHVMLFGVRNPDAIERLELRLHFQRAGLLLISIPVQHGIELSRAKR